MKTNIIRIYGSFSNIYAWGKGFLTNEKANAWKSFWKQLNANEGIVFWRLSPAKTDIGADYLVSSYGSVFLHPMDFEAFLLFPDYGNIRNLLKELSGICKAAAEACGGTFTLNVSENETVEFKNSTPFNQD